MGRDDERRRETNSAVIAKLIRRHLRCSFCKPHRGENARRRPRHGVRKPKSRDRARGRA